jgi:hypothetical protein
MKESRKDVLGLRLVRYRILRGEGQNFRWFRDTGVRCKGKVCLD